MDRVTLNGIPLDGENIEVTSFTLPQPDPWVPLSVRESRVAMLRWRIRGLRERAALRLAPWLEPFD